MSTLRSGGRYAWSLTVPGLGGTRITGEHPNVDGAKSALIAAFDSWLVAAQLRPARALKQTKNDATKNDVTRYTKSVLAGRTPAQYDFDLAVKGWAFCPKSQLAGMIRAAREIRTRLATEDERLKTLFEMDQRLANVKSLFDGEIQ